MGLLSRSTSHVPDMSNVVKGEYRLICTEAEEKVASTGRDMLALKFDIAEYPSTFPVYDNVNDVKDGDKQSTIDAMIRGMKQVKMAFGYGPDDDIESSDLVGRDDIWAVLDEFEGKNGPRNNIAYYIVSQADASNTGQETAPVVENDVATEAIPTE